MNTELQAFSSVAIRLNPKDNIAVARTAIVQGSKLQMGFIGTHEDLLVILNEIPAGHKFAIKNILAGAEVIRYGQRIGNACQEIRAGEWVHTHNLELGSTARSSTCREEPDSAPVSNDQGTAQFLGYRRSDGRAGTRNYIAVLSTVSCAAQTARAIADFFTPERLKEYPNVDGVIALVHYAGCSTPQNSLAAVFLKRITYQLATHPNIGGAVYVSLGCEENQVDPCEIGLDADARGVIPEDIPVLTIQKLGGIASTFQAGVSYIQSLLPKVNVIQRTPVPASELTVALQCGASDGWSGVSANPVVGLVSDRIVGCGGTTVLAETPEIFGAEQLLARRAASDEVCQKLLERVSWWQHQAELGGFSLDQNPTPGNKAGGLTTIFEKSLGAVAKGGSTPLQAVYEYAERVAHRGFVFMDSPGNDPVSVTGQVAGGCNLVLFTTGRGSVFGGNVSPCVKIASNTTMYERMQADMDFNAGTVLTGQEMEACSQELFDLVLRVASGERTKSEGKGFRDGEFIPWMPGTFL
jgi:altronate dehydratase